MIAFAVRQIRTKQTLVDIKHYSGGKCNKKLHKKLRKCQANLEMSGCHVGDPPGRGGVTIHTHHSTKSIDKILAEIDEDPTGIFWG